jgi:hypothetical protein
LRLTQGSSVDVDGLALVPQSAEQSLGEIFVAEQLMPLVILEVGCNQRRFAAGAFFHQFKNNVGLFGAEI